VARIEAFLEALSSLSVTNVDLFLLTQNLLKPLVV